MALPSATKSSSLSSSSGVATEMVRASVTVRLGVRKVCHAWKANPGGSVEDPWILPQEGKLADRVELIEKPLCYDPAVGKWSQP